MRSVDEIKEDLLYYSALICLGCQLDIAEVRDVFNDLLDHGVYSDAFIDIIYVDLETMTSEAFYPALRSALSVMNTPVFNHKLKAKNQVIFYHLDRIVNKKYSIMGETFALYYTFPDGSCDFDFFWPADDLCWAWYSYAMGEPCQSGHNTQEEDEAYSKILMQYAILAFEKLNMTHQ